MGELTHHACETGSMHVCVLLSRISPIDCYFFTEDIYLVCKRHAVVNYFAIKSSTCAFFKLSEKGRVLLSRILPS